MLFRSHFLERGGSIARLRRAHGRRRLISLHLRRQLGLHLVVETRLGLGGQSADRGVCLGGSVAVDEWMVTESYAHVHHIVSNVSGQLRPDVSPVDVLRALFPGGTITGVPKYRCMQLIAGLEGFARGPYTGSLGYINLDGDLDFNILIRTISIADGSLSLRAGAGIVADSDPAQELNETRAKARGLLRALGVA